jgi:hypothetical protein
MKPVVKFLALVFVASLAGCDPQLPSKVSAQAGELAATNQRLGALEVRMSALEQTVQTHQQSVGNWTLWQVNESLNAGYPQAFSAYSSKTECLSTARTWSYAGGKVVLDDPIIFQFKGFRVRLECLPTGTTPYAH